MRSLLVRQHLVLRKCIRRCFTSRCDIGKLEQQLQQQQHRSSFSTSSSNVGADSKSNIVSEVRKGPAIIYTTHSIRSRPQPNLLYIPGLRSLPFWTQQQVVANTSDIVNTRVAYGDPTVSAIVEYLDTHYETIRDEYNMNFVHSLQDTNKESLLSDVTTYVNHTPSSSSNQNESTTINTTDTITSTDTSASNANNSNEHTMHLLQKGKWDWYSYMTKGSVIGESRNHMTTDQHQPSYSFHQYFPQTTAILQALRKDNNRQTHETTQQHQQLTINPLIRNQLLEDIPFGYVFFSTLHEQTNILPHTSPINFRLRIHVPIHVPEQQSHEPTSGRNDVPKCGIRVGNVIREWYNGKSLVLDDSYEHEVWNNHPNNIPNHNNVHDTTFEGRNKRVVLLIDIWHPDITPDERKEIRSMFQTAKDHGWLS